MTAFLRKTTRLIGCAVVIGILAVVTACSATAQGAPLRLATGGTATGPIFVKTGTIDELDSGKELARFLQQITGATFTVQQVDVLPKGTAIVIGTPAQFPELGLAQALPYAGPADREHYIVRTTGERVLLVGTTALAADHAVFHFLEQLGCRWFFPGPNWEVIPKITDLRVTMNLDERPDYLTRQFIHPGNETWGSAGQGDWARRNRMANSINVSAGDGAYGRFTTRNKELFKQHPEYYALVKGKRTPQGNFCVSNPELRKHFTDYILDAFRKSPDTQSMSVGPDDTPVWCECEPCVKLGSPSDRAVLLANQVDDAVAKEFPGKTVGMYAYSGHQHIPSIKVHPNVSIAIANGYLQGNTFDELLQGWHKQGANVAVREYSSVIFWDFMLPWKGARAGNLAYWREKIPFWFKEDQIRVFLTETTDAWGLFGLQNYVANKLFWDVDTNVDAVVDDFLHNAFGNAATPMRAFYTMLDASSKPQYSDNYMGRLYRLLAQSYAMETDPGVRARIDDLTLYLRYVDYFVAYDDAMHDPRYKKPGERLPHSQAAFEQMLRFTWKIRATGMVSTYANWRWLQRYGGFAWPGGEEFREVRAETAKAREEGRTLSKEETDKMIGLSWQTPEGKHPWKEKGTFTTAEIAAMRAWGIAQHPVLDITAVTFSTDLQPAGFTVKTPREAYAISNRGGAVQLYLWKDEGTPLPSLTIRCGSVYKNVKSVPWTLYDAADTAVETGEVPGGNTDFVVDFKSQKPGLYRFAWVDHGCGSMFSWKPGAKVSIAVGGKYPGKFNYPVRGKKLYLYVPTTTENIVIYRDSPARAWKFYDQAGTLVMTAEPGTGHVSVPVSPERRGTVWSVGDVQGANIQFLTIPPLFALSPDELLLPKEVIPKSGNARK